jgi:hypothetical protein
MSSPTAPWAGTWKRSVVSRTLGLEASRLKDVNTFVSVDATGGALRWSFGATSASVRLGFTTALVGAGGSSSEWMPLSVSGSSLTAASSGLISPDGSTLALTIATAGALASVTYKMVDPDTVAVSITEVSARDSSPPVVQEGWMLRHKSAP